MAGAVHRFAALDAIRGICALLVCLFHFESMGYLTQSSLVRSSWVFVDFFFVLSGFVLAHSYGPRLQAGMRLGDFVGLRFMRLYPLHFFMLLLFVLAELGGSLFLGEIMQREAFSGQTSGFALILNLLFLQCFGLYEGLTWNHPSWSIAAEFWTYVIFGLTIVYFSRFLKFSAVILIGISFLILFVMNEHGINTTWRFGFIRCVFGFYIGVLGYAYWVARGAPTEKLSGGARTLVEILCILAVWGAVTGLSEGRISLILPPLFLIAILVFSGRGGGVTRLLTTPIPMRLGQWSYGIYMVHIFVQSRIDDVLRMVHQFGGPDLIFILPDKGRAVVGRNPLEGDLATLLMLAAVIASSALAYKFIELPGIEMGKNMFGRKKTRLKY